MKLKRFVSFVFVLVLITSSFVGFSPRKVLAAEAPPVTEFSIIGYSWSDVYTGTGNYYDASDASTVPVLDSTPYIVTYQIGYGTILSPYSMDTIDSFPITDDYNNVVGFIKVTSLKNLPTGLNNIDIACNSTNYPWNVMRDLITLNIQPPTTLLKSSNTITSKDMKGISDIKGLQKLIK